MFWPDNAQIAVTTSLMFEAGPQDTQKTFGPFPVAQEGDFPDLPTNSWFDYAANEGIQRALELFDRHGVKASSFMTGMSVERYPDIAREIVKRGHEAAAHGRRWRLHSTLVGTRRRSLPTSPVTWGQCSAGCWRPSGPSFSSPSAEVPRPRSSPQ
jgi:hypothetical protein